MQIGYERRKSTLLHGQARIHKRILHLQRRSNGLSWLRLWTFIGGVILSLLGASTGGALAGLIFLGSTAAFGLTVYYHRRMEKQILLLQVWERIKQNHLARQTLDWERMPPPLPVTPASDHPFDIDLDISGDHSLHQLLDTAITTEGSARLREWLLATIPNAQIIRQRQELVRELSSQTLFRDKLTLYGQLSTRSSKRWSSVDLQQWLDKPIAPDHLGQVVTALGVLALITAVLAGLNTAGKIPPLWVLSFLAYFGLSMTRLRDLLGLFEEATRLQDSLMRLKNVFAFLEAYPYRPQSKLQERCQVFQRATRPTRLLRQLAVIVSAASLQNNMLLWLFLNTLMPWDLFFAYQLRRAKRRLQTQLPNWLDTWYELEALCALANFAYLNPGYTFPEISADKNVWQAEAIGHPLIPFEKRVTNDFSVAQPGELALITGSNMSGKSTFLRTIGVNMVLAYAGSVVTTPYFRLSLYRLFTCIRISDSLTDGYSYFYAEVRRLKRLLDVLNQPHELALFFLIDEIFRGTNNRERLIGSRAYISALIGSADTPQNGLGVVSTHDLELTKLADEHIHNYHFTDSVANGHLTFDYRLRPGPSPTTNALRIMALEGLPVNTEEKL